MTRLPCAVLRPFVKTMWAVMAMGMSFAGSMGVSRRSWDIEAAGSIYGPAAHLFLAAVGIGGVLAFLGLLLFILLTVGTLLIGRRIPAGQPMENWGTPKQLGREEHEHAPVGVPSGSGVPAMAMAEAHPTQGTMVLALIFLLSFAVYYFANWKALADVWPVR